MKKYRVLLIPFSFVLVVIVSLAIVFSQTNFFKKEVKADTAQIIEAQTRLRDWGYYNGELTGVLDTPTRNAIADFQRGHGISATGNLDAATMDALGVYIAKQNSNDVYLLAKCIYAEARGEPYVGQVAVGAVILNRVASPDFPNTIYGVIYQPWAFTAVHDGQIGLEPDATAYRAAQDALNGWDPSYGSLYYYNPSTATSSWIFSRRTIAEIGRHVFCV